MVELDNALIELAGLLSSPSDAIETSSSNIGEILGVSQQTACRYLKNLEQEALISREITGLGQKISLTDKGVGRVREIHSRLDSFLKKKPNAFSGVVSSGLGEGAYYVREYANKFKEKIGYTPHPGTLNLKVSAKPTLPPNPEVVTAFKKGDRSFGEVKLFSVELTAKKNKALAHLIVPDRTHHRTDVEFISKTNLRRKLGVSDGSTVGVRLL